MCLLGLRPELARVGGQDCDGPWVQQAPIGSRPIRSAGCRTSGTVGDDRQISSKDHRSVKLRVRPSLTGTHRCHSSTPTGRRIMLTVKLPRTAHNRPSNADCLSVSQAHVTAFHCCAL